MVSNFFILNSEWRKLPSIEAGDIVHLKHEDNFNYLFKIVVLSIDPEKITGLVDVISDSDASVRITGGHIFEYVGKEISFSNNFVHEVVKKPSF